MGPLFFLCPKPSMISGAVSGPCELIADLGSHGFRPGRCATLPQEADPQKGLPPPRSVRLRCSQAKSESEDAPGLER
mgnify:CR=1 FL=1